MDLYYNIAGLTVKMDSFGTAVERAAAYRIAPVKETDIVIDSKWLEVKEKHPEASDDLGEYMYSGWSFYRHLMNFNGLMLHSSAVVLDGKAYLFAADPGTGKSTHTGKWLEKFGDRAFILNDDKPALRLMDGIWYAYGTPWSGKYDISVNTRAPIAGIAMIERADENELSPFTGAEAIHALLKQVNRPKDMQYRIKLMELLDKLMTMVPIWRFKCNNYAPNAVEISYAAMCGGKKD